MDEAKSYLLTEAAELTGLSVPALRKRIVRKTLRGFRSNEDGLWRVWLASTDIEATRAGVSDRTDSGLSTARPVDESQTIKALQVERDAERERAERAEARAERAEREREEARVEAAVAKAETRGEREARDAEVRGLREALAEARKPFWRRWIG